MGSKTVKHELATEQQLNNIKVDSLVAQMRLKESACKAGDLGWEDPLEKGMATHSSNLAWRIPWTEEPSGLQSIGSQRAGHD